MRKLLTGNYAVALAASLAKPDVVSAYPITPQTSIVEKLSEYCASGELDAELILVESEHSALASLVGASQAGARTFTATSSHGLAYMHEMLHWAVGARLPIVLVNVNRAMGPGWNIWSDQGDTVSARDVGWLQIYTSSNQEALDSVIQAFRVAETLNLPVMVITEAFVLSHTSEAVDVPDADEVSQFIPPRVADFKLDTEDARYFGALVTPEFFMDQRYLIHRDQLRALDLIEETGADFAKKFGRSYGLLEQYRTEDAETMLVTMGSMASTAQVVVDELRNQGRPVGLVRVRAFRPFPQQRLREALGNVRRVVAIDRNVSYGHTGALAMELRSALYTSGIPIYPVCAGLGGRDVRPETIKEALEYAGANPPPEGEVIWLDLRE